VLEDALRRHGDLVLALVTGSHELLTAVTRLRPDVIIAAMDSPDRDTLEHMQAVGRDQPCPIVLFTHDGDPRKIEEAIRAGVSAYVVDGLDPRRLRSVVEVAIARFRQFQRLKEELAEARTRLEERKLIERAKGIVMEQRGVPEPEAYRLLRKMAMDRGLRLGDLASSLIAAAELLRKA
jgi:response regulator NasT